MSGKITITPHAFPQAALTLPLGKKKPLPADGTAQWTTVPRPRRRGMTEYEGEQPLRYLLDVSLDLFPDGDVEPIIRRMFGWAARLDLPFQPTLLGVAGPIIYPDLSYFLSSIELNPEVMDYNDAGRICRVLMDLELTEYVAPDLVIQSPPPAVAAQARSPEAATGRTYTVARGDTLSAIASRLLGKASRWQEIADANGVRDPRRLQIGQILKVPNA